MNAIYGTYLHCLNQILKYFIALIIDNNFTDPRERPPVKTATNATKTSPALYGLPFLSLSPPNLDIK